MKSVVGLALLMIALLSGGSAVEAAQIHRLSVEGGVYDCETGVWLLIPYQTEEDAGICFRGHENTLGLTFDVCGGVSGLCTRGSPSAGWHLGLARSSRKRPPRQVAGQGLVAPLNRVGLPLTGGHEAKLLFDLCRVTKEAQKPAEASEKIELMLAPEPPAGLVWVLLGLTFAGSAWMYQYLRRWEQWDQEELAKAGVAVTETGQTITVADKGIYDPEPYAGEID